jgi:calcineurin-like phosphoesterase family protein
MAVRRYFLPRTAIRYFGHGNIIKYCKRPFLTDYDKQGLSREGAWKDGAWINGQSSRWRMTEEAVWMMNNQIINNINDLVGENDTLWHLGDWAFAPKNDYYQRCRMYRDKIKCRNIYLVWGNHDHRTIGDLFNGTYDQHELYVGNQRVIVNHYAMAAWNKSHRGSIQLFGHSHGGADTWLDSVMPGHRSMDVGVDVANRILGHYRPFSFEEIMTIMNKRTGHSIGDHHEV